MNILVLGGTQFLGRHFVELALQDGHKITMFNRGRSNPTLFKEVTHIKGDRNTDLHLLHGLKFDVVLDTCGYFPINVKETTLQLKDSCKQFIFISTCSVYDTDKLSENSNDENSSIVDLNVDTVKNDMMTYGARKFLCEEEVRAQFNDHACIIRPGLIVGPHDPSYRFSYWGDRISEGGNVLAPGDSKAPVQYIDVRDLASFILTCIENKLTGEYNAVTPNNALTFHEFLNEAKNEINPKAQLHWVSEEFLTEKEIACWSQLPLWIYKDLQNFCKLDSQKAISHGLKYKHLKETLLDTHNWSKEIYKDKFLHMVLDRGLEQSLVKEYLQRLNSYSNL